MTWCCASSLGVCMSEASKLEIRVACYCAQWPWAWGHFLRPAMVGMPPGSEAELLRPYHKASTPA